MKRLRLTPLLAMLFAPLAHADLFHSEFVPGQCLGNSNGNAVLVPCGPATKLQFGGYGAVRLAGQCLGSGPNPEGRALRWESCERRNPPPQAGGCEWTPDQCWAITASSGKFNNEVGWTADVLNENARSGAAVGAWKWGGGNNQKWTFRNLITVQQATATMGLNPIGGLQLRNLDGLATSKPGNPLIVSLPGGNYMVAAGGGNMVAAGGGNMVAAGGGNMVAAGGGNMVAAGGGNLIDLRASTLRALGGAEAYIGTLASLVGNDGASLVGNDGASLIGNDGSTLTSRLAGYFSKQQSLSFAAEAARMVAAGGGNLLGNPAMLSQQAIMAMATSSLTMTNSITGSYNLQSADLPANLDADKAQMLTRIKPQLERLAAKVKQMRADGQTIPPTAINGAKTLHRQLQEALVAPPPLPVNLEPQMVSTLNAIERLLNQPVAVAPVAPPPPPPAAPPPPQAPPAPPPQPALAAGPCGDPWVNDTVAKTLNRPARGSGKNVGECNISRYGNGSWGGDYQDLLRKTQAAYAACSDKWVSAAVWEVLGRAPQGSGNNQGDCNHARYANGRWGNYDDLVAAVRQAQAAPVAPPAPPPAAAPVAARMVSLRSNHAPGKCMAPAAGGGFILWDCVDNPNQRFSQEPDGSIKQNNQCLGASGNTLRLEPCYAQATHQKWTVDNGALRNGNVPASCIDIDNGSRNNGARLLAWSCHGGSNQKWSLQQ